MCKRVSRITLAYQLSTVRRKRTQEAQTTIVHVYGKRGPYSNYAGASSLRPMAHRSCTETHLPRTSAPHMLDMVALPPSAGRYGAFVAQSGLPQT